MSQDTSCYTDQNSKAHSLYMVQNKFIKICFHEDHLVVPSVNLIVYCGYDES